MDQTMILGVGIVAFVLAIVGVVLTVREFKSNVYPRHLRATAPRRASARPTREAEVSA